MVAVPIEVTATTLAFALVMLAGVLAAGGTSRRALALGVAASVTLVPWMPLEARWMQAFLAVFSLVSFGRVIDLVRMPISFGWPRRAVHAISAFDSRKAVICAPELPVRSMLTALLYMAPMLLGLFVLLRVVPRIDGSACFLVRSSSGLVFVYCLTEAAYAAVWGMARSLGFRFPALHVAPILARSVQEFWGERWNRTVSDWLRINCFMPFARRRKPVLGVMAAFVVSAGLHAYMTVIPLGIVKAGWMLAYFLLQTVLIGLERFFGIARWSAPAAHAWTVTVMVLASPLFVEPMLEILSL
ncbi:MAG: MBOAT family protein [Polyangiaceae bacterium]